MAFLRRRTKKHGKKEDDGRSSEESKTERSNAATATSTAADTAADTVAAGDETLWQVFSSHPLVRVLPIVLIPYMLYTAYYYISLQHPEWVSWAVDMRPPVAITDERQLLIVGTMSSGTVQVAADLYKTFQLEMGHETSDSEWNFVRDGTVSWFHGIRYMTPPLTAQAKLQAYLSICGNSTGNMGFHPTMYKTSANCSTRSDQWSQCWARDCFAILDSEWGCAMTKSCETPFRTTLHQVRHPLRTLESLVTKFCKGGVNGTLSSSFVSFASALFPQHMFEDDSCIEATGYYVVKYNQALIEARKMGLVAATYRIEDTSPCEVARMAGFMDEFKVVYAPNLATVTSKCRNDMDPAHAVMTSTQHKINVGLVSLDWNDLQGGMHGSQRSKGDSSLIRDMKKLMESLGYDPNEKFVSGNQGVEFY